MSEDIKTAIALLNSMVRSGESHTELSAKIVVKGLLANETMEVALATQADRIAELESALVEVRGLNETAADENGHKWVNSDLIDQTIRLTLSKSK